MNGLIWIVTLKCYECGNLFALKGIRTSAIQEAAHSSKCPDCGRQPEPERSIGATIVRNCHEIVDLRQGVDAP